MYSVAFLADGRHIASGGEEGKTLRWRVEDGRETGTPMDVGYTVFNIAASQYDSMGCGELLKSNRAESTQRLRHGWVLVGCRAYQLKWGDIDIRKRVSASER